MEYRTLTVPVPVNHARVAQAQAARREAVVRALHGEHRARNNRVNRLLDIGVGSLRDAGRVGSLEDAGRSLVSRWRDRETQGDAGDLPRTHTGFVCSGSDDSHGISERGDLLEVLEAPVDAAVLVRQCELYRPGYCDESADTIERRTPVSSMVKTIRSNRARLPDAHVQAVVGLRDTHISLYGIE